MEAKEVLNKSYDVKGHLNIHLSGVKAPNPESAGLLAKILLFKDAPEGLSKAFMIDEVKEVM